MRSECSTRSFAHAGDNVHHAIRHTRLLQNLAQAQGCERRLFGGLEDDTVASSQHGAEFPRGHQQREIPRDNLANHTHRLAHREGVKLRARRIRHGNRNGVTLELRRPAGHVMKQIRRERHIGHLGNAHRFAIVEALQLGQLIGVFENEIADFPDELPAFAGGHGVPSVAGIIKHLARGGHGLINILGAAFSHLRNLRATGGVVHGKRFTGCGGFPFAIDEEGPGGGQEFLYTWAGIDFGDLEGSCGNHSFVGFRLPPVYARPARAQPFHHASGRMTEMFR